MKDASRAIVKAVRAALIADASIGPAVGTRIAANWGATLVPPYIRIRVPQSERYEIDDRSGSRDGAETRVSLHAFVKDGDAVSVHEIAAWMRDAFQDRDGLVVDGAETVMTTYRDTVFRADPDDPALQMAIVTIVVTTVTT